MKDFPDKRPWYCPIHDGPCRADCVFMSYGKDGETGEIYPEACELMQAAMTLAAHGE